MSGKGAKRAGRGILLALVVGIAPGALSAQRARARDCSPAGVWYGGSVVAYQLTITATGRPGHFSTLAQGMFRNAVMNTAYTGELLRKGDRYEGPLMQLTTADTAFMQPPPTGKMPDINAGWGIVEMIDCNTIRNTIPFFGTYAGAGIWQPGVVWTSGGKVPLVDPPDVDLLNVLNVANRSSRPTTGSPRP